MKPDEATHYRDAGVDLASGDRASRILYEASRATWPNRAGRLGEVRSDVAVFSGARYLSAPATDDVVFGLNFDGVGTKIEIAERVGRHDSIAHDLLAMVCDDASAVGCEPLVVGSILDCQRVDPAVVAELAAGMVAAAALADVAVINGETAELGARVAGYGDAPYNWGAAVMWAARKNRLRVGIDVRPGDSIVALAERGFRSNGLSLARKVFRKEYGDHWHNVAFGPSTLGQTALEPSIIYSKFLVALSGGVSAEPKGDLRIAIHVTGGGIPGKLGRVLRLCGYGAEIENLFDPPEAMIHCQRVGRIPDIEAYQTWNMGQGLLVICSSPRAVIQLAEEFGLAAQEAGVIQRDRRINLVSRGSDGQRNGLPLTYDLG